MTIHLVNLVKNVDLHAPLPSHSAMEYYLHRDGQQWGPYDEATLRSMLAAQQVLPTDLIWNDQMPDWATVESVFPTSTPAPAPAPIPAPTPMPTPVATAAPAGQSSDTFVKEEQETATQASTKSSDKSSVKKIAAGIVLLAALGVGVLFLFSGGEKPEFVDFKNLEERNGLTYEKGESDPFTGKGKAFFPDGKSMKEVQFKEGKENGQMTTWYENGQMSYKANFIAGEYEGEVATWSTNGVQQSISIFQNGNEVSRKSWDENGNEIK